MNLISNTEKRYSYPRPIIAAGFMLGAMILFSTMGVFIKLSSSQLHPLEVVFFRNFLALFFLVPWIFRQRATVFKSNRKKLYTLRAIFNVVGMAAGFTALTLIPLAEATALSFTAPLFATLGAALILGEIVRQRRIIAIFFGFLGMFIILRPGIEAISPGALLAIANAITIAITVLIVKKLTTTEKPITIVVYMALLQTPMALIPALFYWEWPSLITWTWLFCLAGAGTIGHLMYTKAIQLAEVSQLQPIEFVRLPVIALFGYTVFAEQPSIWVWLGGAVIFLSTAYVTHREATINKNQMK